MFNPSRFGFARRRRGLTKRALAGATGASTRAITAYEAAERTPSDDTVRLFARVLQFPYDFFFGDDLDEIAGEGASFRSLSRMTAGQRNAALAAGTLGIVLGRWIEDKFRLPECSLPDFHEGAEPEAAAESIRSAWGLGDRPIRNVIHLLEAHGVRVFSLVEDCREVDAFSLWDGSTPFVFLNTKKSAERGRYDACHELGHLVLHRHGAMTGRKAEEQANAFASALLMPKVGIIARDSKSPSIGGILNAREAWGVSAMAYGYRLHQLEILSDWYYQQIMRKLSSLGYRSDEHSDRPRETSQILRKVFESLRQSGVTMADVAGELQIGREELQKLIFGLVLTSVPGEGSTGSPTDRAHLRIVRP